MDLDKILAVTVSGVRPEEERAVKNLLGRCDLVVEDLTTAKLRYFLVARKGDEVIGTVGLEVYENNALLRSLAVSEAYRGQGVAKMLLSSVEKFARTVGVEKLWLLTMTAADLFAHLGYDTIDRIQAPQAIAATAEFQRLCPDSAVCMCHTVAGLS